MNSAYDALLAANQKRLISAEGIQLRTNRSIQMEGNFAVLKGDFQFKQFNHRRKDNVHKILYILKRLQLKCGFTAFCYSPFGM